MPPHAVVTGAAGFIGSHLCARLLDDGWSVRGLDSLTDFTPTADKRRRLAALAGRRRFAFARRDLARDDLATDLARAEGVFHLAGQAGVRGSFGGGFADHLERNVRATHRLCEALAAGPGARVVLASTSSVYGEAGARGPVGEDAPTLPRSPYGVTKLAAEGVARTLGVAPVVLRYFSVYGPDQRPDMAFHRFLRAALEGAPAPLHGDGSQTRDFTFVGDVVDATVAAATAGEGTYNIGGGSPACVADVLTLIAELTGREVPLLVGPPARGDVRHTCADARRAARDLGWTPAVGLREGLARQLAAMTSAHLARRGRVA